MSCKSKNTGRPGWPPRLAARTGRAKRSRNDDRAVRRRPGSGEGAADPAPVFHRVFLTWQDREHDLIEPGGLDRLYKLDQFRRGRGPGGVTNQLGRQIRPFVVAHENSTIVAILEKKGEYYSLLSCREHEVEPNPTDPAPPGEVSDDDIPF